MRLPRFYPIFDSAEWIARTLPLGVRMVQLRIKECPDEALRPEIARAVLSLAAPGRAPTVGDGFQ